MPPKNSALDESTRLKNNSFREKLRILLDEYHNASSDEDKSRVNQDIRQLIQQRDPDVTVSITRSKLEGLDLSGLDLQGADFTRTQIIHVNFTGSNLSHATFRGADRKMRNLVHADFSGAQCDGVDFSNCDLRKSTFATDENQATITDASLKGAWLSRSNLEYLIPFATCNADKEAKISLNGVSVADENLSYMNLSNLYLSNIYFGKACLQGTHFGNSDVSGADFRKVKNLNLKQLSGCLNVDKAQFAEKYDSKMRHQNAVIKGCRKISYFFPPSPVKDSKQPPGKSPKRKGIPPVEGTHKKMKTDNQLSSDFNSAPHLK